MKICLDCKEEKQEEEFCKNKSRPDGLTKRCKLCERDRQKKYRDEREYLDPEIKKVLSKKW